MSKSGIRAATFGIPRIRVAADETDSLHRSSALGLRKTPGGFDVYAPFGFDVFGMVVRPN